jgi:hypothetical protein
VICSDADASVTHHQGRYRCTGASRSTLPASLSCMMASRDAKDGGSAQCPKDAPALSLCGFGAPGRAAGTDLIDPRCGHRDTSDLVEVQSDTGHETVLIPKIWMIDCMLRNHDQVARRTGSGLRVTESTLPPVSQIRSSSARNAA